MFLIDQNSYTCPGSGFRYFLSDDCFRKKFEKNWGCLFILWKIINGVLHRLVHLSLICNLLFKMFVVVLICF